jgi:hypothetical protein
LLTRLKHQLRDLILTRLNQPGAEIVSIQAEITAELNAAGVIVADPCKDRAGQDQEEGPGNPPQAGTASEQAGNPCDDHSNYVYGDILSIDIKQPDMHPELVAATTTLGVCCGSDTSLYLFQRQDVAWALILAQETNDYDDGSGAQGSFDYRVSPPDPAGGFFVVTANVGPSCTKEWVSLRYQALRPSGDAYVPQVLLNETQGIEWFGFTLEADVSAFTLKFWADQGLDVFVKTRPHVVKFSISENLATRVPPLAELPEDFLDEWLDLPWDQAARWADPAALPGLQHVHEALQPKKKEVLASEFLFVRPCPDLNQWQIGLAIYPDADEGAESATDEPQPDQLFFTIEIRNNVFFVQSVSETPQLDCSFSTGLLKTKEDPLAPSGCHNTTSTPKG